MLLFKEGEVQKRIATVFVIVGAGLTTQNPMALKGKQEPLAEDLFDAGVCMIPAPVAFATEVSEELTRTRDDPPTSPPLLQQSDNNMKESTVWCNPLGSSPQSFHFILNHLNIFLLLLLLSL